MRRNRVVLAAILMAAICMLLPAAHGELSIVPEDNVEPVESVSSPVLTSGGLTIAPHSVSWPVLTGLSDESLQEKINDRILEAAHAQQLVTRLAIVMSAPETLTADWEATLSGNALSILMSARGPVNDLRPTEELTCLNISLTDGSELSLESVFTDADAATEAIEDLIRETVIPDLSGYLDTAQLLPLPDQFYLSAQGITFCYPIDSYITLSGRAGRVFIRWSELLEYLDTSEDSTAAQIGALSSCTVTTGSAASIRNACEAGELPGLSVKLGASLKEALDRLGRLKDPDLCEIGQLFSPEDASFRDVSLITDRLSSLNEESLITGIRSDRYDLYGLCTGLTTIDEWRDLLGTPDTTITLTEEQAEAWRLPAGTSDYYQYGSHRLRLHCGEDGVLAALLLLQ